MTRKELEAMMLRLADEKQDALYTHGKDSVEYKVAEKGVAVMGEVLNGHAQDTMEVCSNCGAKYPLGHDWEGHVCSRP